MPLAKTLATLALLLAIAPAAAAEEPHKAPRPEPLRFEKIDANHDGFITLEELRAGVADRPKILEHVEALFGRLDRNQDGKLDKEEFRNPKKGRRPSGEHEEHYERHED